MASDFKKMTLTSTEKPKNILYSEVEEAISALRRNKSTGSGRVTAEMIQAEGQQLVRQIHGLCNKV